MYEGAVEVVLLQRDCLGNAVEQNVLGLPSFCKLEQSLNGDKMNAANYIHLELCGWFV
jgi:hypothetical protein